MATNQEWDAHYPYEVDYCDHFETPREAYQDIVPLLQALMTNRQTIRVYDPYYCNGRTAVLLNELGFTAIHEKRDFYQDIRDNSVPDHDVLVTNPPYSEQHKKKCLEFCFEQLRGPKKRPFAILMPNYVAARQYYQQLAGPDAVYLIPKSRYQYDHPEGTGKADSPFASLWFLGIGAENVERIKKLWERQPSELVTSLEVLSRHAELSASFQKRPNPRQRKKKRKQMAAAVTNSGEKAKEEVTNKDSSKQKKTSKNSKYRDDNSGKRKRKRF